MSSELDLADLKRRMNGAIENLKRNLKNIHKQKILV